MKNKEKMENQPHSKTERAIAAYNSLWKEQNEIYSAAARSFGLSDSAMWILYFLRLNNGTCQQKELASSLSQPKQTTNSAVKQLERGGYVTLKCALTAAAASWSLRQRAASLP